MRDSMVVAMEWFRDELGRDPVVPGTADVNRELDALIQALALFPIR